ncbi:MAG: DUF4404 family protein [Chloroflexi bacterium]|nr:DUF4404 family protein [Chloroflexota bacterium]
MKDQSLRNLLEQLQGELKRSETMDTEGRELLRGLEREIHQFLERAEGEQARPAFLRELEDSITHFEVTHPALTRVLSEMLNTLNNAGI